MKNCSNISDNSKNINCIIYYLSLGSNMGDRAAFLKKTLAFLQTLGHLEAVSSIYETEPVDMTPGTQSFFNQAAGIRSRLSPPELLAEIKRFESKMGRNPNPTSPGGEKKRLYYSRPIDIDILLAGDRVVDATGLVIPHERMAERAFVLMPLNEIAPGVRHPVLKKTINQLLSAISETIPVGSVKKRE